MDLYKAAVEASPPLTSHAERRRAIHVKLNKSRAKTHRFNNRTMTWVVNTKPTKDRRCTPTCSCQLQVTRDLKQALERMVAKKPNRRSPMFDLL